jgi:hypothetical protein
MRARSVGKWAVITLVAVATGAVAASCGGSDNSSTSSTNGLDSGTVDGTQGGFGDSSFGGGGNDSPTGCTHQTCAQLGFNCGKAVTCGALINCNANGSDAAPDCPAGQTCGASTPNVCGGTSGLDGGPNGDGGTCTPQTCVQLGYDCGEAVSCGTIINCNANGSTTTPDCPAGQVCGGGGKANQCAGGVTSDGGSNCTPKTCAQLGYNCGLSSDGCAGTLNCNANGSTTTPDCPTGQICGYGSIPNVCGPTGTTSPGCDGGGTTALTGYVFDPANNLPIYNALVYVPVGAVQTPQTGVVPAQCGCTAQPAYASAFTDISGKFTLSNPPSGANVTIVVQLGKWQRVFTESITACTTTNLGGGTSGSAANLTLPSDHTQGNIPLFAIDTGNVDSMECVLLKMGIAQSEFVNPGMTAAGGLPTAVQRIQMYQGTNVAGGAIVNGNTPPENWLTEYSAVMNSYDVILFPCQGHPGNYGPPAWPNTYTNMANYSAAGGRFFTTHYHYDMLQPNPAFSGTAHWTNHTGTWGLLYSDPTWTADINQGFARGVTLSQWLNQPIVYGGTYGQIPVGVVRNDYSSVNAPALNWLTAAGGGGGPPAGVPEHYTFDTPFNQSPACGRVVYSDFHVESEQTNAGTGGMTFPTECAAGGMTPQEKLLEFMLFDLTSCVVPPTCTPLTCASYPTGTCGQQTDGCGGLTANCGSCATGQTCGGGGVANQCGAPPDSGTCVPMTCPGQGIACGPAGDGCGGLLQCGTCPNGTACNAGQCYPPDGGPPVCVPKTCAQQGVQCGPAGDGCGNIITCPPCPNGQTCNSSGQCVTGSQ